MTTEVRSTATTDHTKARESTTQKTTQILGTPVHPDGGCFDITLIVAERVEQALHAKGTDAGMAARDSGGDRDLGGYGGKARFQPMVAELCDWRGWILRSIPAADR